MRPTPDTNAAAMKEWLNKNTSELPSFFVSVLPIAVPVLLLTGHTVLNSNKATVATGLRSFFNAAGDPVIALFIATGIAL